jgi:hypothetical protein
MGNITEIEAAKKNENHGTFDQSGLMLKILKPYSDEVRAVSII